jgi:hypothetical protein
LAGSKGTEQSTFEIDSSNVSSHDVDLKKLTECYLTQIMKVWRSQMMVKHLRSSKKVIIPKIILPWLDKLKVWRIS